MKKIFILFLSTIAFSSLLKAQGFNDVRMTDIKTPNSSTCVSWITEENENDTRRSADNLINAWYEAQPQLPKYGSYYSTRTFNCHGYAWLKVDDSSFTRWIGIDESEWGSYPEIFMTDGSYTKITAAVPYAKVFRDRPGDHSGVIQPDGTVISKWGDGPLMKHALNYGPDGYNFNGPVSYWIKTSSLVVDGPSMVCGANTFSIKSGSYSITPVGTLLWEKSANLSFNGSSNGASVSVSPNGSGLGWVSFKINGVERARKEFWVGPPVITSISGGPYPSIGAPTTFTANVSQPSSSNSFSWLVTPLEGGSYYMSSPNGNNVDITFYNAGYYQIGAKATNACGTTPQYITYLLFVASRSSSKAFAYPNPADNIINVDLAVFASLFPSMQLQSTQSLGEQRIDLQSLKARVAYDVRLYDGRGNMLRQQKVGSGIVEFDVSNLPNDTYYLHVYNGVESSPTIMTIIVQH